MINKIKNDEKHGIITNVNIDVFTTSLPILYVLYGEESQMIKVGKTIHSNNRIQSYISNRGKSGNQFRKYETIRLLAYYRLPNIRYTNKESRDLMAQCENQLISNATSMLGRIAYGNEWFDTRGIETVDLTLLFKGIDNIVKSYERTHRSIMLHELLDDYKTSNVANYKHDNDTSNVLLVTTDNGNVHDTNEHPIDKLTKRLDDFVMFAHNGGYLDNQYVFTKPLYKLFLSYLNNCNETLNVNHVWFSRTIKPKLEELGLIYSKSRRLSISKVSASQFYAQQYIDYIDDHNFYDTNDRLRYFENKIFSPKYKNYIRQFEKHLNSEDADWINNAKHNKTLIRYFAQKRYHPYAIKLHTQLNNKL